MRCLCPPYEGDGDPGTNPNCPVHGDGGYPCPAMPCDGTCKLPNEQRTHNRLPFSWQGPAKFEENTMPGGRVTSSHTYTFNIYGVPIAEQLIEELQKGVQAVGPRAKTRVRHSSDQRDGETLMVTMTGNGPQMDRGSK